MKQKTIDLIASLSEIAVADRAEWIAPALKFLKAKQKKQRGRVYSKHDAEVKIVTLAIEVIKKYYEKGDGERIFLSGVWRAFKSRAIPEWLESGLITKTDRHRIRKKEVAAAFESLGYHLVNLQGRTVVVGCKRISTGYGDILPPKVNHMSKSFAYRGIEELNRRERSGYKDDSPLPPKDREADNVNQDIKSNTDGDADDDEWGI